MQTGQGPLTVITKEMGITHKDFYAELPALFDNNPYQKTEETIVCKLGGKRIEIILGPEQVRQLGRSVRLPVTAVNLRFFDFSAREISDFVRQFNLRFMKGGG